MVRLKDDLLDGGTNGRMYYDGESNDAPYRVREVVAISKNKRGADSKTFVVVQYERGSARLPLDTHLYDVRLSNEAISRLLGEGKFKDEDFRTVGM